MFCPNCGTQNADTATTCSKCGFNLKGAAAPKFKGTMLMVNAPANVPRAPAPAAEPAKPAVAMPSKLKGTMLGVAPPSPGAAPAPPQAQPPVAPASPIVPGLVPAPAPEPPAAVPPPPFGVPGPGAPAAAPPAFAPPSPAQPAPPMPGFGPPAGSADPLGGTIAAGPGFPTPPGGPMAQAPQFGPPPGDIPAPPPGLVQTVPGPGYQPPGAGFGASVDQAMAGIGAAMGAAMQPMPPAPMMMQQTGPHGPIGQERNWLVITIVGSICFIAFFWYYWCMLNELKAFRQKEDMNPIMYFVPLLNILLFLQLPEKVLDAKRMAGIPNPEVQSGIIYLFLSFYFLPNDLNEIWQAASKSQPR